jgi:hypothetical protein
MLRLLDHRPGIAGALNGLGVLIDRHCGRLGVNVLNSCEDWTTVERLLLGFNVSGLRINVLNNGVGL